MSKDVSLPAWDPDRASQIIADWVGVDGGLLPLLHDLQAAFGCIAPQVVPLVAQALNLSRAEVHGALTFYHDFRRAPPGSRVVKLCRAEACQARGGRDAEARLVRTLGLQMGETAADGSITLEPAYCLGLCASGPAALVDGAPMARLTGDRLSQLITDVLT